jgi:hypothetical protein
MLVCVRCLFIPDASSRRESTKRMACGRGAVRGDERRGVSEAFSPEELLASELGRPCRDSRDCLDEAKRMSVSAAYPPLLRASNFLSELGTTYNHLGVRPGVLGARLAGLSLVKFRLLCDHFASCN